MHEGISCIGTCSISIAGQTCPSPITNRVHQGNMESLNPTIAPYGSKSEHDRTDKSSSLNLRSALFVISE